MTTVTFEIDTSQVRSLAERMRERPREFGAIIEASLRALGSRVAFVMRREMEAVKYTGAMERSVSVAVRGGREAEVEIGPTAKHAVFVRFGTKPHWAPIAPLKRWAAWKLGDEKAAYAVQRSIAKFGTSRYAERLYGTKSNPFTERTLASGITRAAIQNTARRLAVDMVTRAF